MRGQRMARQPLTRRQKRRLLLTTILLIASAVVIAIAIAKLFSQPVETVFEGED